MKGIMILFVVCLTFISPATVAGCNIPTNLAGTFLESTKGVLTFNSTGLSGLSIGGLGSFDFNCYSKVSNRYILESNTFQYFNLNWKAYVCWDFTEVNSNEFYYYEMSDRLADASNERVKMYLEGQSPQTSEICTLTSAITGAYKYLLKNESVDTAQTNCPTSLQKYFTYTHDSGSGDNCANDSTLFGVCSNDLSQLTFNYSSGCNATQVVYSTSGSVNCLYNLVANNLNYITLFNRQYSSSDNDTSQFVCLIFDDSNTDQIQFTQHPGQCQDNQTSTYVPSPGAVLVLNYSAPCIEPTTIAPPTTEAPVAAASVDWIIALATISIILIIIISAAVVYYYVSYQKEFAAKQKKLDDKRAVDVTDSRWDYEDDAFGERGQAPPHLRIMFPDYTKRSMNKRNLGNVETSYGFDDFDGEYGYNGFDPTPRTLEEKANKEERMSNDSALGMEEDESYVPPPIAATPEYRTNHEVKAFNRIHGRQNFKSEEALTNISHPMKLVKKIKKFARKKQRKSEIYQTPEPGLETQRTEDSHLSSKPNYIRGIGKGHEADRGRESKRKINAINPAGSNSKVPQLGFSSDAYSSSKHRPKTDDDVASVLAGTALQDADPRFNAYQKKRNVMKGVHYSPRAPGVIMEDLEDQISKHHTEGFVSNEPDSPTRTDGEELSERKAAYLAQERVGVGNEEIEVTPNMKIRKYNNNGEGMNPNEVMSLSSRNQSNYINRLNRKAPKRLAPLRQSKSASSTDVTTPRKKMSDDKYKKLLEEMYPDKKYFDYTKDSCGPSEEYLANKTNEGLEYLQGCADYWDQHQAPERPHSTPSHNKGSKSSRAPKETRASSGLARNHSIHQTGMTNGSFPPNVS